jgi:hypothetical protein
MLSFKDAYLDTSNYPREHFLYSERNALVVGKMKDECSSLPALEFVGLRSKMYSLLISKDDCGNDVVKKTAKDIKKEYIKIHKRHEMYVETLHSKQTTAADFLNFCSRCHRIETVHFNKVCLTPYDEKKYVLSDGVNTLAYGHYLLKDDDFVVHQRVTQV